MLASVHVHFQVLSVLCGVYIQIATTSTTTRTTSLVGLRKLGTLHNNWK